MEKLEHILNILFFEFNRRAKAAGAATNICTVYGNNAIGESTARNLVSRFKEDRLDISDTPRSVGLSRFDEDRLNTLRGQWVKFRSFWSKITFSCY